LSDQVKSLDWRARQAQKIVHVSEAVMLEVAAKIGTLLV
jgi:mRNA-degrading endonuclease toxin of MazEF toxin-antitoxin module